MQNNNKNKKGQQFMPFDALTGLKSELKKREEIKVNMPIYDDEVIEQISSQLSEIKKHDLIRIKYYRNYRYYTVEGLVTEINPPLHTISIGRTKILFETILEITNIEE